MKAIKLLLALVTLVIIVVVGGVAAFIGFADPNDFKGELQAQVKEATGRELSLDGDLAWSFWPKLSIKAGPLALGHAPGFGDGAFLAADNVQIAVATLPLLSNRIEMDTVVLHGVAVNLARDANGLGNWEDLGGGGAEEKHGGGGPDAIVIGGVDIKDARFTFKDAQTGQDVVISNVTMSTGALKFGEPLDFVLTLSALANQPALDSDITMNATVSYDLDNEHYQITPLTVNALLRGSQLPGGKTSIDFGAGIDINLDEETATISDLKLTGLGSSLTGQFAATNIEDERPSANGEIKLTGADIAAVFNAFALPVGKQLARISDRKFDFEAAFDANMDTGDVVVNKLSGNMLGAQLGGGLTAKKANTDEPSATGQLSANGPDLPTLLAVLGQLQGADAETLKSLNAALARAADKSFSIKADLDADLASGNAALPTLEAKLLGNTINGKVTATSANTDKPNVTATLRAAGPDFPTLLTVIAQFQGADAATLKGLNSALGKAADRSFSVGVDVKADMASGTADVSRLDAKLLGNSISGSVKASKIDGDKPAASGTLNASGSDLAALLAIASQMQTDGAAVRDMAAALAKEQNKAFTVALGFDTDLGAGRLNLDTLSADLLGLEVRGGLKGKGVDFEKSRGALDGQISVKSGNLGTLLRTVGQGDLAKSVLTLDVNAGIKGDLSNLSIAPLGISARVNNPQTKTPVDLKIGAGEARADLDNDTLTLRKLSVTGLGLNAKADLDVRKMSSAPDVSGTLNVGTFNLKNLLRTLSQPVPKTANPDALTAIAMKANIASTPTSVRLDDIYIALDKTNISGNVDVRNFAGPDLGFTISIDSLNADDYLEPGSDRKPATPEAAAAGAASEIPVETLRGLKLDGKLNIANLVLSGAKMNNVSFGISANQGLIKLAPLGARLYNGAYGGDITLNAQGSQPVLDLKSNLNNINVEPLIMDTVGNNMLAGVVNFDAALNGNGGSSEAIKKSLTGNAKFLAASGVFRGVDAVAVLRAVEQIIECKCPVQVPKGGETVFNQINGTITANNGVLHNQDLLLTGDGFTITGKGMLANLHDNTTKYNLELGVDETQAQRGASSYNLGGYKVPIKCRGAIESPSCLPDVGGILEAVVKNAAKDKVQEAIGEKIEKAIGGEAGEALKKIFKF